MCVFVCMCMCMCLSTSPALATSPTTPLEPNDVEGWVGVWLVGAGRCDASRARLHRFCCYCCLCSCCCTHALIHGFSAKYRAASADRQPNNHHTPERRKSDFSTYFYSITSPPPAEPQATLSFSLASSSLLFHSATETQTQRNLCLLLLLLRFDVFMFSFSRPIPVHLQARSLALPIAVCARCCQFKCFSNYLQLTTLLWPLL